MRKTFFIFLFLLPQLALSQQKDNSTPKLLEIGFRMNLPFIAMNYHIGTAKELYKQQYPNNQEPMEFINERLKFGYDVGLYFSAGVNFAQNWQFEFRYGKAINEYRPPASGEGWITTVGFILKRYSTNKKLYWAILMYISNIDATLGGTRSSYGQPKDRWKEIPGIGFGMKIWKGLYAEASVHGVLGDKSFYYYESYEDCRKRHRREEVRLTGFGSINIGYSFEIFGK